MSIKIDGNKWWGEEDLNLRRRSPADLQSAPFGHLGISPPAPLTATLSFFWLVLLADRVADLLGFIVHAGASGSKCWRWREDSNPRPTAYKAVALPLSYASSRKT